MSEIKEITFETPSSSGESEKLSEQRRRIETKQSFSVEKFKEPSKFLIPFGIRKSLSEMDMKLLRNEHKQIENLHRQLRRASEDIQTLQSSVENLTTSLISAKADASLFQQKFLAKEQENDSLNNIVAETNNKLFKSMSQVRHLQKILSCQQRSVQLLENQKNEILSEINVTEMKWKKKEEQYLMDMYKNNEELLAETNSENEILETLIEYLKEKEFEVNDLRKSDHKLKNEIEILKSDALLLKAIR